MSANVNGVSTWMTSPAYGNEEKFNQMSKDELAEIGEKCKSFDAEMQAAGEVTWGAGA